MDISRVIQSAFERYQAGSVQEAANICIEITAIQPNKIDALPVPGEICSEPGTCDAAIECFNEAVTFDPTSGDAYFSPGDHEKN